MGHYEIQWDLVTLFVVFMTVVLFFNRSRKSGNKRRRESAGSFASRTRSRRERSKGFRRMHSAGQHARNRARRQEATDA
jgi:hypothetical protein